MTPPRSPITGTPLTRYQAKHLADQMERALDSGWRYIPANKYPQWRARIAELREFVRMETN